MFGNVERKSTSKGKGMKGHVHHEVLKFNSKACLSDLEGK